MKSPDIECVAYAMGELPKDVVRYINRPGRRRPLSTRAAGCVVGRVDGDILALRTFDHDHRAGWAFGQVRRRLGTLLGGDVEWTTGYMPKSDCAHSTADASNGGAALPTGRQLQVLRTLVDAAANEQPLPSLREIAGKIGVASAPGVLQHLRALQQKGFATSGRHGAARSWRATNAGKRAAVAAEPGCSLGAA